MKSHHIAYGQTILEEQSQSVLFQQFLLKEGAIKRPDVTKSSGA
jgi:hypothetical protein